MLLVTVWTYRDAILADLGRAPLEGARISAFVLDRHLASIQWLYANAIGGVKLKVEEADREAALAVLAGEYSEELAGIAESEFPPGDGDFCPECRSTRVRPSRVHRTAAALSLATNLPLVAWRHRWICQSCGYSWTPSKPDRWEVPEETLDAEKLVYEKHSYRSLLWLPLVMLGLLILWYVQYQIRHLA